MKSVEVWKDIPEFEGFYQVSDKGRVRSMSRVIKYKNRYGGVTEHPFDGKILTPGHDTYGYKMVHLRKNGERYPRLVHRLVAEAFCEKPEGCNIVNHMDFNILNNDPSNLEWTTQAGNVQWSVARMKKRHKSITNTGVKYITKRTINGKCVYVLNVRWLGIARQFGTLEEAVAYKLEVMVGYEE